MIVIEGYEVLYVDRDQRPCFVLDGEPIFEVWRFLDGAWVVVGHEVSEQTRAVGVAVLEPDEDVTGLIDQIRRVLN